MSIRRKTCETMTLLYEAALKTNPDLDDDNNRPRPVNPTAGVLFRHTVGKAVWVADETRDNGGDWTVYDENEVSNSGVPIANVVVASKSEGNVVNGVGAGEGGVNGNGTSGNGYTELEAGRNIISQMSFSELGGAPIQGQRQIQAVLPYGHPVRANSHLPSSCYPMYES